MSLEELEKEQLDKITHYKLHETELITLSRYVQRKEVKARVETLNELSNEIHRRATELTQQIKEME